MGVIESEWNEVRRQHVFKLMEEQDRVLRNFFAQKKGGDTSGRPTGRGGGAEHLGMGAIATKVMGQVEMRMGRRGGAVASAAARRGLLQSETLRMYIPMCAYPCVHTCNIGVD